MRMIFSAAAFAVAWIPPASAQEASLDVTGVRPQIAAPTNASEGGVPATAIDAEASSEDGEIAFTLSSANNGRLGQRGQSVVSLRLSSPIGEDDDDASFLTKDGLAKTVNLKFSYSRIFLRLDRMPELEERYLKKCADDSRVQFDQQKVVTSQAAFFASHCGSGTAVHLLKPEMLSRFLLPDEVAAVLGHTQLRNSPLSVLNISASIGRKVYDYLDPSDFSALSETRVPFAFSIAYGRNANATAPFWGVGYEFKRSFGAGEERTLCPAPSGPVPVACKTGTFDAPERETIHKVFAMVRSTRLFGDPRSGKLAPAVEFRAAYDIENKALGFTLPVFVLLDGDGSAKGGFRLTVDETFDDGKDAEIGFGVFITKSFDFFSL